MTFSGKEINPITMQNVIFAVGLGVMTGAAAVAPDVALNKTTTIQLGEVCAVFVLVVGLVWRLSSWFQQISDRLNAIERRCDSACRLKGTGLAENIHDFPKENYELLQRQEKLLKEIVEKQYKK